MGIGFLVMTPAAADMLTPQIAGSQNHHLRGGTENIPSIAATKTALESAWQDRCYKNNRLGAMKMYIQHELQKAFDFGHFNDYVGREDNYSPPGRGIEVIPVGTAASLPNTMLFSFVKRGPLAEHFCNVRLKNDLMRAGIVVSIGSACNTANPSPSHVLSAMKAPYVIRCGVVRISLGDQNTFDECRILVQKIIAAVQAQA
jgi:cysteine desulfurase